MSFFNRRRFFYLSFSYLLKGIVDKEYEHGNFRFGEICYLRYESRSGKSLDTCASTSIYYFSIDGLKSTHSVRPYSSFKLQFPKFIQKINKKCYEAEYVEVKILFYKHDAFTKFILNEVIIKQI